MNRYLPNMIRKIKKQKRHTYLIEIIQQEWKFYVFKIILQQFPESGKKRKKIKLTGFHLFFHFSKETSVEWKLAKWAVDGVAIHVD